MWIHYSGEAENVYMTLQQIYSTYQILSESPEFYRSYCKKIGLFFSGHTVYCSKFVQNTYHMQWRSKEVDIVQVAPVHGPLFSNSTFSLEHGMQARIQDFLTGGIDCRGGPSLFPPLPLFPSHSLLPPSPSPSLPPPSLPPFP